MEKRILVLNGHYCDDSPRTGERYAVDRRQADPTDLTFGLKPGQCPDGLFDGDGRVLPVLIDEIDAIPLQSAQRTFNGKAQRIRAAIQPRNLIVDEFVTNLGRNHSLARPRSQRLRKDLLIDVGSVQFGGVKVANTKLQGMMDGPNRASPIHMSEQSRQRHTTKAQARLTEQIANRRAVNHPASRPYRGDRG